MQVAIFTFLMALASVGRVAAIPVESKDVVLVSLLQSQTICITTNGFHRPGNLSSIHALRMFFAVSRISRSVFSLMYLLYSV